MMKNDHVLHALLDLTHCFHSYWKLLKLCVSKEQGPKSKKKKRIKTNYSMSNIVWNCWRRNNENKLEIWWEYME